MATMRFSIQISAIKRPPIASESTWIGEQHRLGRQAQLGDSHQDETAGRGADGLGQAEDGPGNVLP